MGSISTVCTGRPNIFTVLCVESSLPEKDSPYMSRHKFFVLVVWIPFLMRPFRWKPQVWLTKSRGISVCCWALPAATFALVVGSEGYKKLHNYCGLECERISQGGSATLSLSHPPYLLASVPFCFHSELGALTTIQGQSLPLSLLASFLVFCPQ